MEEREPLAILGIVTTCARKPRRRPAIERRLLDRPARRPQSLGLGIMEGIGSKAAAWQKNRVKSRVTWAVARRYVYHSSSIRRQYAQPRERPTSIGRCEISASRSRKPVLRNSAQAAHQNDAQSRSTLSVAV